MDLLSIHAQNSLHRLASQCNSTLLPSLFLSKHRLFPYHAPLLRVGNNSSQAMHCALYFFFKISCSELKQLQYYTISASTSNASKISTSSLPSSPIIHDPTDILSHFINTFNLVLTEIIISSAICSSDLP